MPNSLLVKPNCVCQSSCQTKLCFPNSCIVKPVFAKQSVCQTSLCQKVHLSVINQSLPNIPLVKPVFAKLVHFLSQTVFAKQSSCQTKLFAKESFCQTKLSLLNICFKIISHRAHVYLSDLLLIIIIDRFYIALFSAFEQTHCARTITPLPCSSSLP